jgi:hypothetical protein
MYQEVVSRQTVLLSLHLLRKDRDQLTDDNADVSNPDNDYLTLPPKEITDLFSSPPTVLPVSKRCCPGCSTLVKYVNKTSSSDTMLYPGEHTVWAPFILPPWIPREAGLYVLEEARKTLKNRIRKIIDEKKSRSRASSADTSEMHSAQQNSPYRSDDELTFCNVPELDFLNDVAPEQQQQRIIRVRQRHRSRGRKHSPPRSAIVGT